MPSAVEINLPSSLSTSCCPFSVSEKSHSLSKKHCTVPSHTVPSKQEEVTERHVIKGALTSPKAKSTGNNRRQCQHFLWRCQGLLFHLDECFLCVFLKVRLLWRELQGSACQHLAAYQHLRGAFPACQRRTRCPDAGPCSG